MKTIIFLSLFVFPAFLFAQEKNTTNTTLKITATKEIGKVLKGIASYYHDKFEGRKMANGKYYSKVKATAACNVLPLNKWVKVTNLTNGQSVIVKITDRMHPKNKRLIDLSYASAKKLEMLSQGLAKVKVEVLNNYEPALP